MKYITITLIWSILITSLAFAEDDIPPTVLLAEIQLGSVNSASEEYIEIVNTSVEPQSLENVHLQYKSKSGSSWTTKAELNGWMAPYGRYLISNYLEESSMQFNGGLSGSSGHIRLAVDDETIDLVGWGEAVEPDGEAVSTHNTGQSLKRMVNEDGEHLDSDDNNSDWFASDSPSPAYDVWQAEPVGEEVNGDPVVQDDDTGEDTNVAGEIDSNPKLQKEVRANHKLVLSEIMPDPTTPLTDAEHEFIEIFNPNKFSVQLEGYKIEAGKDWRYKYVIDKYALKPGEYIGILSGTSGVTLSNAGSSVRILSPNDVELDSVEYPKAKPGMSWSKDVETWGWAQPTLNANNLRLESETNSQVLGTESAPTATPLAKQDVNFPATTNDSENDTQVTGQLKDFDDEPSQVNNWVLAGVGSLAVLYAIYEYRNDIRIRIQQLRRYFEVRRENRAESKGR